MEKPIINQFSAIKFFKTAIQVFFYASRGGELLQGIQLHCEAADLSPLLSLDSIVKSIHGNATSSL